jgi:ribosomal protein L40E
MYMHVVKCRRCGYLWDREHEADFYNHFPKFICTECGAESGCWVDVRVKRVGLSVWYKPWTWGAYNLSES